MIQHLLQLIWNQRKQNAWLWAELLLVSVFLWFLVDYLYVMGRTYTAPLGFDIRHTYSIVISSLSERSPDYIPKEKRERPDGVHLLTALDRIRTYPGVESACLTDGGMPYYMGSRNLVWRIDTLQVPCRYAFVTPEFFDVFRIYDKDGKTASLKRAIEDNNSIVISADVETMNPGLSLLGQKAYRGNVTDEIEETIRGISVPIRRHEYTKAEPNVYRALRLSRMEEGYYEGMIDAVRLCVRVRPDVDNADFPARFRKDMAEQLRLGNLYLLDVQPLSYIRDGYIRSIGVENEVKTRVAVACFLLANIFLGIIGILVPYGISQRRDGAKDGLRLYPPSVELDHGGRGCFAAGLGVHPVLSHQLQHRPYGFDRYLSASVHVAAPRDLRRDYVCLDRPHDHLWRMVSCPLDSPLGASGGVAL